MFKNTLRIATLLLCATLTLTSTAGARKNQIDNSLRPGFDAPVIEQTVLTGVVMESIDSRNFFFRSMEQGLIVLQFDLPVELDFGSELILTCGRHQNLKFNDESYTCFQVLEYK